MDAIFHDENGKLIKVKDIDKMAGKNGYTYIIFPDGKCDAVESWQLTYGNHNPNECEICEELFNI